MRTKHEIYVLSGHAGTVMSLQMQSLEPHIISGSQDKMVRTHQLKAQSQCCGMLRNSLSCPWRQPELFVHNLGRHRDV